MWHSCCQHQGWLTDNDNDTLIVATDDDDESDVTDQEQGGYTAHILIKHQLLVSIWDLITPGATINLSGFEVQQKYTKNIFS